MPDPTWSYPFAAASAFAAGAMNSVAGGGTLLTFPALLAVLSPVVANATSTVALLPGSMAGAWGYRAELAAAGRFVKRMLPASLAGGLLGAWLAVAYPQAFADLVPWLVLTAAVLFLVQQPVNSWMRRHKADHEPGPAGRVGVVLFQFLVAVYGGYFGAGIGILMLAALGFMAVGDIHRMNAVKTCLASAINAASVAVFVWHGAIDWGYAAAMLPLSVAGGYAGARVARRLPARYVRWAVIAVGFGLAGYYFATR